MDKFLESLGYNLTYGELTEVERATVHQWYDSLKKSELTLTQVRDHIGQMREAVEHELTKPDLNPKEDVFLKARLKNYILIESLLSTPEKARKAIERDKGN